MVPELGDPAVREIFVKSYRLIYELREEQVIVLAFVHGARRFPGHLF
jgi:toxin ParE1/3/4